MEIAQRIQTLLLEELRAGKLGWYYVSVADDDEFKGGYFIEARGPTEANHLLHTLGWWVQGCCTKTQGPLPEEKIPESYRWRRLSKEEVKAIK